MAELDKVIKGITHCLSRYVDGLCDDCPYMGELDKSYMIPMKCKEIIMRDALELLKELIDERHYYEEWKEGYGKNQQQIVHCKDCKYHAPDMCCNHPIEWDNGETRNHCNPEWYCADGELKD